MKIRDALRQLRKELDMNQSEFASMLHVSNITVNRWENGKNPPNRSTSMLILMTAKERGASNVCLASLQEALFPKIQENGLDDLKYAEISKINQLLNDSSNIVIVCDVETKEILYLNRQAGREKGTSIETAKGKKCYEYLLNRDTPCVRCKKYDTSEDSFSNFEYYNPRNNKHYLIRAKRTIWKERPALIEYITDTTELYETKKALEERQKILLQACKFAEIWIFRYDIKLDRVYFGEILQEEYGCPEAIEGPLERLCADHIISPESQGVFREFIAKMRAGVEQAETEIRGALFDQEKHWFRFRMNIMHRDEQGNPEVAICSAQRIDIEKTMENRFKMEKEKQANRSQDFLGYVVSNLSKNMIIEKKTFNKKVPFEEIGNSYTEAIQRASENMSSKKEKEDFRSIHNRDQLLKKYNDGIYSEEIEFHQKVEDGDNLWLKNELSLLMDPVSKDILLYEYSYDINEEKIYKEMLKMVVAYNFEFYAALYLESGDLSIVDLSCGGDHRIRNCSYEDAMKQYGRKEILDTDWELYCEMVSIENIREKLKEQDTFGFNYRMKEPDGSVHMKHCRYHYFDKERGICMVSRIDIDYPTVSI